MTNTAGTYLLLRQAEPRTPRSALSPLVSDGHANGSYFACQGDLTSKNDSPSILNREHLIWCSVKHKWWQHFITIDTSALWREHLAWGKKDGKELLGILQRRFGTFTVLLTLVIGSEVTTLFSTAGEGPREALRNSAVNDVGFWVALILCFGIFTSFSALIATISAWSLINAVSPNNAHAICRSSMGLYGAALPVRLVLAAIYIYFTWVVLFFWTMIPWPLALPLTLLGACTITHIVSTYSTLSLVTLYSGAIWDREDVISPDSIDEMSNHDLSIALLEQTRTARKAHIPVSRQYRMRYHDQLEALEEGGSLHLSQYERSDSTANTVTESLDPSSPEKTSCW